MTKVLIIDDSEFFRGVFSDGLVAKGFQVEAAESGKIGLEKMLADPPQLIILDLIMPEMSGEDVLREIQKHENLRKIPVIMLTSISAEVVGQDVLSVGSLVGYMKKDEATAEDMAKKVQEILGSYEKPFDPKASE